MGLAVDGQAGLADHRAMQVVGVVVAVVIDGQALGVLAEHLDEHRVEVADRRLAHGGEHARVDFRRTGPHQGALRRMEQLIQEAVVTVPKALLAETIDLVAVLVRHGTGRRLAQLMRVEGLDPVLGDYRLTPATPDIGEDL